MKTHHTACPRNCYSTCSFLVEVEQNRVVNILPQPKNKATPNGVCLKGLSYLERANSPERLLQPQLKKDGQFVSISWEEAFRIIAQRLISIREEYQPQAVLYYTASGMSGLLNSFGSVFWEMYGGATTAYGNLCWPAGLEATRLTLGDNKHNAPWDLEHAKLIIAWGKNIAESNIQQMIPLEKALEKGARYVVVDTRRTQTAEKAELLLQPNPGTDAALALAIANVIISNNWHNASFVEKHVVGFEEFKTHVSSWTVGRAAKVCNVPEEFIFELAQLIGTVRPMTLIPGYGMQRYSNGGQTMRALLALQVITGNIGEQGACWHYANLQSYVFDSVKEPMSYFPTAQTDSCFRRAVSVANFGHDVLALNDPPIKMIWIERANPVTQIPDTKLTQKALRSADFCVVVDQFMTDTALEADLVLPAKNMFEQSDIIGSYWNPYVQLKPKVVEPAGEVKPETEIYWYLANYLQLPKAEIEAKLLAPTNEAVEQYLKQQVERFPELSWEKLQREPQVAPQHQEIAYHDLQFSTKSGKIELFSEEAHRKWGVPKLPTYEPLAGRTDSEKIEFPFYLMTPNTKNRIHSQFGNLNLIRAFAPYPTVQVHPDTAHEVGLEEGKMARVYNSQGEIDLRVSLHAGIRHNCVAISNGWWLQQGACPNVLSRGLETDMGHGTAFHDTWVNIAPSTKAK